MYLIGTINSGGYIYANQGLLKYMVHRETVGMHHKGPTYPTLGEAKERWSPADRNHDPKLLIALRPDGGVKELWAANSLFDQVTQRLTVWRTCYGGWPVKRLND